MTISDPDGLDTSTRVEEPQLAISASLTRQSTSHPRLRITHSDQGGTDSVPCQTLDRIAVPFQCDLRRIVVLLYIPKTDQVVSGCRCEEALGRGVEDDLSDFAICG
jgi:hypothetical protein